MRVNLDEKTVTFQAETVLTLGQLTSLVDIVNGKMSFDLNFSTESAIVTPDPEAGRYFPVLEQMHLVESDNWKTSKVYCVVRIGSEWACSCPSWTKRKSETGEHCKHISRLTYRW
jgi:hypothetical protein